jgi:4-hydroxy-2-oxoheptanedioate aldolase
MFRPNALKRRLRAGKKALGCWTVLGSPPVIELLAYCGFDYLLLDQEHGFGEPSALLSSLQAMAATPNCTSVVGVPSNDPNYLKRVLDAGVEGVMVPNVETVDDARAVVAACRYPPLGRRGSALGSARASDYGINSSKYKSAAADELLIVCQIESPKAVENIEAIAAVDGVDVLFIGPHDLSGTVGQLGDLKHPEVARLILRAEEGIKKSGKPMGTVPHPGATWREMFQRGYQMINAGSDVGRLRDGALAEVKEFRSVYS